MEKEIIMELIKNTYLFDGWRYDVCVHCGNYHRTGSRIVHKDDCAYKIALEFIRRSEDDVK